MEEQEGSTPILGWLPNKLMFYIFGFIAPTPRHAANVARTCKHFFHLMSTVLEVELEQQMRSADTEEEELTQKQSKPKPTALRKKPSRQEAPRLCHLCRKTRMEWTKCPKNNQHVFCNRYYLNTLL